MNHSSIPELSKRTRGWLRFVWDKSTTEDDWSVNGTPHAWWDRSSTAPMCAIPRFDLTETAFILPVVADQTPAWREVYTRIADELVGRHTTFWAAIDWLTLIGHDPHPDEYPPEWLAWMPTHLHGRYDPPGWTANGVAPWGLQPDPIGSDGNLFFRGFFNLLLAIYRYVAGDDKWEAPFRVAGYRDATYEWTHHRVAEFINLQWKGRPQGPHCENTKIWPYCVSGAGLGLQLTDTVTGTSFHGVYGDWVDYARKHYLKLDRRGGFASFPLYYDPLEQVLCQFPDEAGALAAIAITPYVIPQDREFAEVLYRNSVRMLGWSDPEKLLHPITPDPRWMIIGLLAAREIGDLETAERIRGYVDEHCDPRWFGEEDSRFGYWFGLDEPHPRGQLSALLVLCEAGEPGAWTRVFRNTRFAERFDEPTVVDVDYPSIGLKRAWYDPDDRVLTLATYAATPSHQGRPTRFTITQLPNAAAVVAHRDGVEYPAWRTTAPDSIEVETLVGEHVFRIECRASSGDGGSGGEGGSSPPPSPTDPGEGGMVSTDDRVYQPASPEGCSCC